MSERELYCDSCRGVQLFEVPPCADGHGADCPELICTDCGAAVLIATFRFGPAQLVDRPASRSSGYRHAA